MTKKTKIILTILIWILGTTFVPAAFTFVYWALGGDFKPSHDFGLYAYLVVIFQVAAWAISGLATSDIWK